MLMGADDRAIHTMEQPVESAVRIRLWLEGVKELFPDARPLPALEAAGHGGPRAIALGQIAPGGAGAQDPPEAIADRPMVMGWPPDLWCLGWEQWWQPLPRRRGQISSVHVASPPFLPEKIATFAEFANTP
jgi:hypothetical protein